MIEAFIVPHTLTASEASEVRFGVTNVRRLRTLPGFEKGMKQPEPAYVVFEAGPHQVLSGDTDKLCEALA